MIVRWEGHVIVADREALAGIYRVSERTVRRRCQPRGYDPQTRAALYDALGCADQLEVVSPRASRAAAALRARMAS